ncbi:MAG: GTP-binding protein [Candidatus Micrarchaeia archaeon]
MQIINRVLKRRRVLILGAAGRDFHNFNVYFRDKIGYEVVGFTLADQLPVQLDMYPSSLAGKLYPHGIPIYKESDLEKIIREKSVDLACLSYSDLSHNAVMHIASRVLAAGASFILLGPNATMLKSQKKVIAVCATRTGAGKSPMTEYVSQWLRKKGFRTVIVRHPMPYGELEKKAVQRYSSLNDLDAHGCTIEEREDYERHIRNGFIVYAGIDYERVLRNAEKEADVIIWDGGNNDYPFFRPDIMITVADAMRAGHEIAYHPGEVNFRMADVIAINKWENAKKGAREIEWRAKEMNPHAKIIRVSMDAVMDRKLSAAEKKRVLVIEDGPTITHGEMPYGIGYIVAKKEGCSIIDGSKFAVGVYKKIYAQHKHIEKVVPAVGYSREQIEELKVLIGKARPSAVVSATPTNLSDFLDIKAPLVRVTYKLRKNNAVERVLESILAR